MTDRSLVMDRSLVTDGSLVFFHCLRASLCSQCCRVGSSARPATAFRNAHIAPRPPISSLEGRLHLPPAERSSSLAHRISPPGAVGAHQLPLLFPKQHVVDAFTALWPKRASAQETPRDCSDLVQKAQRPIPCSQDPGTHSTAVLSTCS